MSVIDITKKELLIVNEQVPLTCPKCQLQQSGKVSNCARCGINLAWGRANLKPTCLTCNTKLVAALTHCPQCGVNIEWDQNQSQNLSLPPNERPGCITIYVIFQWLFGAVMTLSGLALIGDPVQAELAPGFLLIGFFTIVISVGLWRLRKWAWWVAIIGAALGVLVGLVPSSFFYLPVNLIIFVGLYQTREAFQR